MIETKIIIVDDDEALTTLLKRVLEDEGFMALTSKSTNDGYRRILKSKPDLAIIDIKMPVVGGFEFCKMLRANIMTKSIPIIMLTTESTEMCKLVGFANGADDYVTKPFSNRELIARIRSLLRRVRRKKESREIKHDGLVVSLDSKTVTLNNVEITLRPKEFELLYMLMSRPNMALNREVILENVFEYNEVVATRTIDTHIKNLRQNLGPWARHIVTIFGIGFKFVPSSSK